MLVGKGITFDTGGLDIKPAESMSTMKRDMTGGAVGARHHGGAARRRLPGAGGRPGARRRERHRRRPRCGPATSIRHYGGRTSEVTNTDAEGRLVLADAMAYAVAELRPDVLVDIATLTGAMKVALGQRTGGYFANDEALADAARRGRRRLRRAAVADAAGGRLRGARLASKVADADNAAGGAGAITAALFLQHFVGDVPWAHLDIASIAEAPAERYEWTAGPTGFGPRLLLTWLGSDDPLEGVGR